MKKRIISLVLVVATLLSMLPTAAFAANGTAVSLHPFTDVKSGDWYNDYVSYAYQYGIFKGTTDTTFDPQGKLTRAMFVTVLGNMVGIDTEEYDKRVFEDVDPAAWYGPYVAWAAKYGITSGVGDGLFAPDAYVTRQQIAAFLDKFLSLLGEKIDGAALTYADADEIVSYAKNGAAVCLALGLIKGDDQNRFRPEDPTTRAEAAVICSNLHKYLVEESQSEQPQKPENPGSGTGGGGGTTTEYHKITFANPADPTYAAEEMPDSTTVESASLVYNLPLPKRANHVFCGWFYDEELTNLAATTDTVTADMTLYPKMVERLAAEEEAWPVYTLNYVFSQDVAPDFTVQVQASSVQQIRDTLTFAAYSERDGKIDYDIVDEGSGIYTIKPAGGLVPGDTYQIVANDRDREPEFNEDGSFAQQDYVLFLYGGEVMPSDVQYYNITVACEEYSNMRLDNKVIFLPFGEVSGIDLENAMLYSMSEEGFEVNDNTGTFTYDGDDLSVGDVVAIYDGILDEETHEVDGNLAYVKIAEINGNTYSYGVPGIDEVLFTPLALPIPLDNGATGEVDGAFFNEDGTVTVYNEYLDFSDFAQYEMLSLDGDTTAEVGDYLVLYSGELETANDHSYYEITDIRYGSNSAVTTFTVIEREQFAPLSVYEVYTGDLGITPEAIAELKAETKKQAIESGFAEEAAHYLAQVLIGGEEIQEAFAGYMLKSVEVRSGSDDREWYEGGEWNPNVGEDQSLSIEAGAIEAGVGTLMVEVGRVDVHVDSATKLEEITAMQKGLRLELGLTFSVQIGNYIAGTGWSDCINLQVSASFVQEVGFSPYAKITEKMDSFLGIPYVREFQVKAGVDVGTYVGVGGTFTVISADDFDSTFPWEQAIKQLDPDYDPGCPNVDSIARQIREMMGDETTFALGNGKESLITIYRDLLEKEIDYVEILAIRCPGCPIKIALPYKIGQIKINLELVISAKMSVTVGLAMENLSVRRYEFNAWIDIIAFEAGYSTNDMDLQTPYAEMNLYIMGNIGLRVGPRISVEISLLSIGSKKSSSLATAGFSIYFGYTVDMYGIYFMHVRVEDGEVTDGSRCIGALEANHGIFLDLDFHLGVILDLIAVDLHVLDLTWNILDKKGTPKVFEATQRTHDAKMWNTNPYYISNHLLNMNTLTVKTGESSRRLDLSHRNFNVELSNPYFTYHPADGRITVTEPVGSVKEECEIRLTYTGSDTLFTVTPITVIINLTWEKTWPSYFVRFCNSYFVDDDGDHIAFYWENPVKEYKFVQGDTITGIQPPVREIPGYDFLGWYYMDDKLEGYENNTLLSDLNNLEGHIMPSADINLAPKYQARTDVPYTLHYYLETVAGTGAYELYKSVTHEGTADSYIPAAGLIKSTEKDLGKMDGFKLRYDLLPTNETGSILGYVPVSGDGSGSGNIYLDRESYSVFYHINNKDYTGASVIQTSGVYGAELSSPPNLVNADVPGWTFVGWTDSDGNPVEIPDTVPTDTGKKGIAVNGTHYSSGTHYFAQWEPSFNYYTVNHHVMMPNGEYELVESQVGSDSNPTYGGYTGEFIDVSKNVKTFDGAKFSHYVCTTADGIETTRILGVPDTGAGDKQHNGQVLDIYYNREYFRVYWNGADSDILQYYYPGQAIAAPEGLTVEEKTGYVADGWKNTVPGSEIDGQPEIYRDGSELVMGTLYKNFEPNYIPAEGTKYTVIHKRPAEGSFGDFSDEKMWETVVGYGTTDTIVTPEVKQYDGFVSPEAKQLYIRADGSASITYEYERQDYSLTLDFAGGEETVHSRNYYYDVSFRLPRNVTREGYEFKGWKLTTEGFEADIDDYDGYVYGSCLTSMQDLTFVAQWEAKQIGYKVEHYLEKLDGSYELQMTDTSTGIFGETVSASARALTGFSYDDAHADNVSSGVIAGDGSLVLKLYYTRNSYDASWYDYDGITLLTTTRVKYGQVITAPEHIATREGYTFGGWDIGEVTMTTAGASFNAKDHGIWSANTYTLAFDANGGTGAMDNQSMTYDQTVILPANGFVRTGYTFAGWSLTANGAVIYADQAQVSNLSAESGAVITLYAQWTAGEDTSYTVKYYLENLDGSDYEVREETFTGVTGSTVTASEKVISGFTCDSDHANNVPSGVIAGDGSLVLKLYYTRNSYDANWYDYDGTTLLATTPFKYEQAITAPEHIAERDGYTFGGWDIGEVTMTANGVSFNAKDHGSWTANTYTLVFDANGGTGTMDNQSMTYDQIGDLPANSFERTGYTFGGWSLTADGAVIYSDRAQVSNLSAEDGAVITLYAQWTAGEGTAYTVKYYLENLDGDGYEEQEETFTGVTGSTVTASEKVISGFTCDSDHANNVSSGVIAGDGSLVLKLYYTRNSYDANWYDYDGTTLLATTPFKYEQAITAPEHIAEREGYTFGGWDIGEVTMTTAGASFNAKNHGSWTANTYTLVFDANGATGAMDNQSMTYDQTVILPANGFVRTGYTFAGWSLTANGAVIYADQAQVSNLSAEDGAVVTLYAQWTAGEDTSYTVKYYLENLDGTGYEEQEEIFTGVTGSTVTASEKVISGFTCDSDHADNVPSGVIAGDGSLVLKLYYTRNSYTLSLDFGAQSIKAMTPQKYTDSDGITWTEDILESPDLKESGKEITLKYGQSLTEVLNADHEVSVFTGIEDIRDDEGYWIGYEDVYETYTLEDAFPGYIFAGWGDEAAETMPAEDMTLTAQWDPIEVKVTFYADYGTTIGEPLTQTYYYGDVVPLFTDPAEYGFVKDGYFISGWSYGYAASDGAVITGELVLIDCYYPYYGSGYSASQSDWDDNGVPYGEVSVYAFWSKETDRCTITFNGNGATNVPQYTQDVDGCGYLYTALLENRYTRDGYRFVGWNTEADGTGYGYADVDMTSWDNATTLYAQWEEIE